MSRVVVKSVRTGPLTKKPTEGDYSLRASRKDDFHVNPAKLVNELCMDFLRCIICSKYSSGKLFECKENGHLVCQDCYTLMDLSYGCVYKDLTGTRCCSPFWNDFPSKALKYLVSTLKFCCLHNSCTEIISGGDIWNEHLQNCVHLNDSFSCPDSACKESTEKIKRSSFRSHCQQKHGINFLDPKRDGSFSFDMDPSKFETGPSIAFACQYQDILVYLVAMNEDGDCVRLTAFIVQRDCEWSSRFRVVVETQHSNEDRYVSIVLKVNPAERDWNDLKIFGRSQLLLYAQLDSIFSNDKKTLGEKKLYPLEIRIQSVAELDKSKGDFTWERCPWELQEAESSVPTDESLTPLRNQH